MRRILTLALACLITGCTEFGRDYVVEQGECCGFRIGQTRQEVAAALIIKGITNVTPEDARHISVRRRTAAKLAELKSARGICSMDNLAYSMQVRFDSTGHVDHLDLSYGAGGNSYGIAMGQSRDFVLSRFAEALQRQPGLIVSNCLPGASEILLRTSPLEGYEAWFFHEAEGFSYGKLVFAGDKLSRIEYHYRPHEES